MSYQQGLWSSARRQPGTLLIIVALATAPISCSWARASRFGPVGIGPLPNRVEVRQLSDRPTMSLIAREGDPSSAVAFAVAHDLGSAASVGLARALQYRLATRGFNRLAVHPHGLGFEISATVDSPEAAQRFVMASHEALRVPFADGDPSLQEAAKTLGALGASPRMAQAESMVSACSGDLGWSLTATVPDASKPVASGLMEVWRVAAFSSQQTAFAGVGERRNLEAAAAALANGSPWPHDRRSDDPWPSSDFFGVDRNAAETRMSIALRVADGARAISAAASLSEPGATLSTRVRGVSSGWRVDRVVGSVRPRGGCVRIDIASGNDRIQSSSPTNSELGGLMRVALEEAESALLRPVSPAFVLERLVLSPSDPREAAGAAAWYALANQLRPDTARKVVAYSAGGPTNVVDSSLKRALTDAQSEPRIPIELRQRLEAGQGELWAAIASPCGTSREGLGSAGQLALFLRAVAEQARRETLVHWDVWLNADSMGLVAHTPRAHAAEHPEAQAERLGSVLGRTLVEPVNGVSFSFARTQLLADVGLSPRMGFWAAVGAMSVDHPSWLEPRGTWSTLADASPTLLAPAREAFLSGPLRLAVLANDSPQQASIVRSALDRWLGPHRHAAVTCPAPAPVRPRAARIRLETTREEEANRIFAAAPVPPSAAKLQPAVRWIAGEMNREGGWLEQALKGVPANAHAAYLGGQHHSAIIVELATAKESMEASGDRLLGLVNRLASGHPPGGLEEQQQAFDEWRRELAFNPRTRLLDVWRGETRVDVTSHTLANLLRETFRPDGLSWVTVVQRAE